MKLAYAFLLLFLISCFFVSSSFVNASITPITPTAILTYTSQDTTNTAGMSIDNNKSTYWSEKLSGGGLVDDPTYEWSIIYDLGSEYNFSLLQLYHIGAGYYNGDDGSPCAVNNLSYCDGSPCTNQIEAGSGQPLSINATGGLSQTNFSLYGSVIKRYIYLGGSKSDSSTGCTMKDTDSGDEMFGINEVIFWVQSTTTTTSTTTTSTTTTTTTSTTTTTLPCNCASTGDCIYNSGEYLCNANVVKSSGDVMVINGAVLVLDSGNFTMASGTGIQVCGSGSGIFIRTNAGVCGGSTCG